MRETYLEVTFHHGKPVAAYYYLSRRPGQKSYRSVPLEAGLVVDFARGGKPIGIEITAPGLISSAALNRVLRKFGQPLVKSADLQPLRAA